MFEGGLIHPIADVRKSSVTVLVTAAVVVPLVIVREVIGIVLVSKLLRS